MSERPKVKSESQKELDKAGEQLDAFNESVKDLTLDRMNEAPKLEVEPQTKLSQKELNKVQDIYLKPKRSIGSREKFNEKFRESYNFDKEYVQFIAENKEIIGETIVFWTKPYAGMPAEEWEVPCSKPVWGPRYVAEQIRRCTYHRLVMQEGVGVGGDGIAEYQGRIVADKIVARLTAEPVIGNRSVFMGSTNFR